MSTYGKKRRKSPITSSSVIFSDSDENDNDNDNDSNTSLLPPQLISPGKVTR